MKQLLRLLFVSLLAVSWLSLRFVQCSKPASGTRYTTCYNTSFGKTCFTTFFTHGQLPVRRSFEEANDWCKRSVPGSSLVVIKSAGDQRNVALFTYEQTIENEIVITDARKLSTSESQKWSWVNGHRIIPEEVVHEGKRFPEATGVALNFRQESVAYLVFNVSSPFLYICEYSDSKLASGYRRDNKYDVARVGVATWYDARKECLRLKADLASITELQKKMDLSWLPENERYWIGLHRNKWIWNNTGAAITYANWEGGYPDESSGKQCICIRPQCRRENNRTICEHERKWLSCNCNNSYAIVCQKEEETPGSVTTELVATREMSSSTFKDFKSSISLSVNTTISSHGTTISSHGTTASSKSTTTRFQSTTKRSKYTTTSPHSSWSSSSASSSSLSTTKSLSKTTTKTRKRKSTTITTTIDTTTSTKTTTAATETKTTTTATTQLSKPVIPTVTIYTANNTDHTAAEISRKTESTLSITQKQSSHFSESKTTEFTSSSTEEETSSPAKIETVSIGVISSSTSEDFKSLVSQSVITTANSQGTTISNKSTTTSSENTTHGFQSTTTSAHASWSSSSASSSSLSTTKSLSKTMPKTRKRKSSKASPITRTTTTTIAVTISAKTPTATKEIKTTATTNPSFKPVIVSATLSDTNITDHSAREINRTTYSTLSITQNPPNKFSENQTAAFAESSSTGLFNSFNTKEILLILFPIVAVIFIIVAIIFVIRKRKHDRRNEGSSVKKTKQSETVSSLYGTVVPDNRPSESILPSGSTIYSDVELTQRPSSNYDNFHMLHMLHMGKSVVNVDLKFPQNKQRKTRNADKLIARHIHIYSEPYEI